MTTHKLIYPFGKALCEKCGLPVRDTAKETACGFADFDPRTAERDVSDQDDEEFVGAGVR
jgi:hypothetical protein